jgi:DNA (cytosine-5)-methyltransferase 1
MSWLYSQVLVEEYLGDISSDGEQSVQLSGNPIPQAYCAPDKMTKFSRLSRFGMTYKPLTENLGDKLLMLYLEDFLAKTSQPQEKAQELMENEAECGDKWRASFTKYDPDSSSWKTHQCSLLGGLDEFSETWPQWGLMRNGECWERQTLEQSIRGTGFGLSDDKWATPTTMDKLPPKSAKALHKEATQARPGRSKPANLRDQVSNMKNWPTPTCQDAHKATKRWRENHQNNSTAAVFNLDKMFPTPTTRDCKGGYRTESLIRKDGKSRALDALPNAVLNGMGTETVTGQLNPTWVEWLMGWPLGWTELKPLVMDKSHSVPQPLGES